MDCIEEAIRYDMLIVVAIVDREPSLPLTLLLPVSTQSLRLGLVKYTMYLSVYEFVLSPRAIPTSMDSTQMTS